MPVSPSHPLTLSPPSMVRPATRYLLPISLLVLTLTGAYLGGPARSRMDVWAAAAIFLHVVLGVLLLLGGALLLLRFGAYGLKVVRQRPRHQPDGHSPRSAIRD